MIKIGENIKKYRESLDLSQNELSSILQVTPQAISRWEKGAAYPDIEKLPQIAAFFGISIDELMGVTDLGLYSIAKKVIESRNKLQYDLPESKLQHFNLLEKTIEQGSDLFLVEYQSYSRKLHNEGLIDDKRYKNAEESVIKTLKTLSHNSQIDKLRAIVINEPEENLELWKDFVSEDNTSNWNDLLLLRAFSKNQPEKWLEKRGEILFEDVSKTIYLLTQRSSVLDTKNCNYGCESLENLRIAKQIIDCFSKKTDDIFIFHRITLEIRLAYTYLNNQQYDQMKICIDEIKTLLETASKLYGSVVSGSIDLFSDYHIELHRWDYEDCIIKAETLLYKLKQNNLDEIHEDLTKYIQTLLCQLDPFYYIEKDSISDFKHLYELVDNKSKNTKNEYMTCIIAVKTSKGNIYEAVFKEDDDSVKEFLDTLRSNYDTKIDYMAFGIFDFVNKFCIDMPSHTVRMKLCELDKRNLEANMLLGGFCGFISKTIKQTFGPVSKLKF